MRGTDLMISYLSLNKKPELNDDAEVTRNLMTMPMKDNSGLCQTSCYITVGYFEGHS